MYFRPLIKNKTGVIRQTDVIANAEKTLALQPEFNNNDKGFLFCIVTL
jgi:hypothetical protein